MPNIKIKGPKPKECACCRFLEIDISWIETGFCWILQKEITIKEKGHLKECPFYKKSKWEKICQKLKKKLKSLT